MIEKRINSYVKYNQMTFDIKDLEREKVEIENIFEDQERMIKDCGFTKEFFFERNIILKNDLRAINEKIEKYKNIILNF